MSNIHSYAAHHPHTCNKALYIAMALLFGTFGVHKFCAGRFWMGVLYLVFCWSFIPGMIGMVEGILAVFKDSDDLGAIKV